MLTITKIVDFVRSPGGSGGAGAAARYYLGSGQSPSDYSSGEPAGSGGAGGNGAGTNGAGYELRANAMWIGSTEALQQLGVARGSEVTFDQLASAFRGQHVQTGAELRTPHHTERVLVDEDGKPLLDANQQPLKEKGKAVVSLDLTFQPPKSVSALWSQVGPEQRAVIERAVLEGAHAALEHMLLTKPVVRRWANGKRVSELPKGVAAAAVLHVTARQAAGEEVPSPHLHVHLLVVGVQRQDGRFVSADSWPLFKRGSPLEGAAIGRATVAHGLVEEGYEIESGTGRKERFFEIVGIAKGLIERMSPRTKEINEAAQAEELERGEPLRAGALAVLAKKTRSAKGPPVSEDYATRVWRAQGEEFNLGRAGAAKLRGQRGYKKTLRRRQKEAWAEIERKMRGFGPTVTEEMARAIVYEAAQGRLSPQDTREFIDELQLSGSLISLHGGRVTTRGIRTLERRVITTAVDLARRPAKPISRAAFDAGVVAAEEWLGTGKSLYVEQRGAAELLTSGTGWVLLTGRAGTGKGPVLHAVAAAYRAEGWQVLPCAVDGTTKERLRAQTRSEDAYTIAKLRGAVRSGELFVDERTVLLLDEAGKVGTQEWAWLADLCKRTRARLVAAGHGGQHAAIELPGMFDVMVDTKAIRHHELKQIRRHLDVRDPTQGHPWLADYQTELDLGHPATAVGILYREGALELHDTRADAEAAMVEDWDDWRRAFDPDQSLLLVHGSNDTVDRINVMAQEYRHEAGELEGEGIRAVDRNYKLYKGDVVILRNAPYTFDDEDLRRVENGQAGIVESVDAARGRIRVAIKEPDKTHRTVELDLAGLRAQFEAGKAKVPSLRLGYASHTFPAQGATVHGTAAIGGDWSHRKEGAYVGDTRAVFFHLVYLAREQLGWEGTDRDRLRRFARRLKKSQNRKASIRLSEEPDNRINVEVPNHEELPQMPVRSQLAFPADQMDRSEIETSDPLEPFREPLGDVRAAWITRKADLLAERLEDRAWDKLIEGRDADAAAFAQFDSASARETLRILAAKDEAINVITTAGAEADALQAQAAGDGVRRSERRDLLDQVQAKSDLAEQQHAVLEEWTRAEQKLRGDGRHLDQWIAKHGEQAARWLAAERETRLREAIELAGQPELDPAELSGQQEATVTRLER